jgi:hypothetical protein
MPAMLILDKQIALSGMVERWLERSVALPDDFRRSYEAGIHDGGPSSSPTVPQDFELRHGLEDGRQARAHPHREFVPRVASSPH